MNIKKIIGIICVAILTLVLPLPAEAAETTNTQKFSYKAELSLKSKLSTLAKQKHASVTFNNIRISATPKTVHQYNGDADAYASDVLSQYEKDGTQKRNYLYMSLKAAPRRYTSTVFSGVPAIGVCNIHQDFKATVRNYHITYKRMLGSSYQTGACIFQWTPNYSWFEGNLKVLSKGTYSALVKGSSVSFAATFEAIFHPSKNGLWQNRQ